MEPVAPLRPARRRSSLYAAGAMAVLLVVSVTVFSRVNRSTEAFRARVPPAAAPSGGQPAPAPPAVTDVRPTPAPPAASVAPSSTVRPPAVAAVSSPPTTAAVPLVPADGGAPAPTTSAPPADPTVLDVPPAVPPVPPHLVAVCVLGICLTVL
jgi:hypothetical protein